MSAPHRSPCRALLALAAGLLAGCSSDRLTDPAAGPPPATAGLARRAIAVRVDVAAGTVTILDQPPAAARAGLSLALLGANEVSATTSNFFRSSVGQFIAKKVRVRFDVAITNRSSVALLPPTFPTPPAGTQAVLLFPFATTLTGGNGAIDASTDWDGAAINFFNDANCSSGARSDCYRWEPYLAPFPGLTSTTARTVGFDVDPTVQSFTTYFVLAADLQVPGSLSGTISSPHRGPLGHVIVTLTPGNRFAGTDNTGGYSFTGLAPGTYTLTVSGLPGYCEPVPPQTVTVASGGSVTANVSVRCAYIAFTSDRDGVNNIYRMNLDGTGQSRLTNGTCYADSPTWSPDGTKLAYSCSQTGSSSPIWVADIIVMNADGSNPITITDGTTRNWQPDWGPAGRIAFSSWRDGNDEIYVMNPDGTNPVRLTENPDSGEFAPSWSGDGSRIAYTKTGYKRTTDTYEPDGNDVWIMNADGTGTALFYRSQFGDTWEADWSPVSNLVAFATAAPGHAIMTKDAVTSAVTQLTDPAQLINAGAPEWSPDGTRIVFSAFAPGSIGTDVFVMDANGGGVKNLTNSAGSNLWSAWQP
jgi:Tol biopolymer transport system component